MGAHSTVVAVVVGLLVGGFLYVVPQLPSSRSSTIHLVGAGDPGVDITIKLNDDALGHASFGPQPAERTVQFDGQPIKTFQLTPQGKPGTRFSLSRIEIRYGSSVVAAWNGPQLGQLAIRGFARPRLSETGLEGKLTESAGIDRPPLGVLLPPNKIGDIQGWLLGKSEAPVMPNIFAVGLLLGFAASLSRPIRSFLPAAWAALGVWVLAYLSYKAVPDLRNPDPPVSAAVGAASYFGTPYRGQQIAAVVTVLLLLAAAAALSHYRDRVWREEPAEPSADEVDRSSPGSRRLRGSAIVVVAWAAVCLTLFPELVDPPSIPVVPGFDTGNVTAWTFFSQHGLVPMNDYWYPYGYQWLFAQVPLGSLWSWMANAATLGLLAWSIWRLSGRRVWRVVACLVAVGLISSLGAGLWRYLPALVVAITYAAMGPARARRLGRDHAVFFGACTLALLIEPDLILMGLAGAFLVLFGEFLSGRVKLEMPVLRKLLVDAVPVVCATVVLLALWIGSGSLGGNAGFFFRLNDVAAYVASDQTVDGMLSGLSLAPTANTLVALLPFLVLAAGLVQCFVSRRPGNVAASRVLLAAAGPSLILLERSLVRPNDFMYHLPLVAFAFAAILLWDRRDAVAAAITGAFAGAMLAGLQFDEGLQSYLSGVGATPVRTIDSLVYASRPDAVRGAEDEAVALGRYYSWPEAEIARRLRTVSGSERPSFAVLGDGPMLYVWLRQRPPYHVNLYDSAPLAQQRKMIERLEETKPTYLAWDRDPFPVDKVPYHVRDPLVFSYAIDHYVPAQRGKRSCPPAQPSCGAADILRRRRPTEKVPLGYWVSRLGNQIDLGFIPSYADPPRDPCGGEGSCATYAVVRGTAMYKGAAIQLIATGQGRSFGVLMRTRPGPSSYAVRLDRLWFWRFLGPQARLFVTTPGWSVDRYEAKSDDRLY
jgi:hypothetical protein